jgi:transcriptional regulator with XRE-family HTH domain
MESWDELRQAFTSRVHRLRAARGLTRKQLAARLGGSSALGRWVGGRATPRIESLINLSRELEVTLDYLVLGRGPMRPGTCTSEPQLLRLREAIEAIPGELRESLAYALLLTRPAPKDPSETRPANDSAPTPERKPL